MFQLQITELFSLTYPQHKWGVYEGDLGLARTLFFWYNVEHECCRLKSMAMICWALPNRIPKLSCYRSLKHFSAVRFSRHRLGNW